MRRRIRSRYVKLGLFFILLGVLVMVISVIALLPALTPSGLGVFVIGILLAYLPLTPTVHSDELGEALLTIMNNLEKLLAAADPEASVTYLHPDDASAPLRIFIPMSSEVFNPQDSGSNPSPIAGMFSAKGLLLDPPGAFLLSVLERESGRDLWGAGLDDLEDVVKTGFVQSLELVSAAHMTFDEHRADFTLQGDTVWKFTERILEKSPVASNKVGCPLCSAAACLLAKSSQRDIRLVKAEHSKGNHIASFELLGGSRAAV
jgi:hypothetical protein